MSLILHIIAIAFGAIAFFSGPDAPKRMFGFGALALATFIFASTLGPSSKDYGVECERYSAWATNC